MWRPPRQGSLLSAGVGAPSLACHRHCMCAAGSSPWGGSNATGQMQPTGLWAPEHLVIVALFEPGTVVQTLDACVGGLVPWAVKPLSP